MNDNFVRAFHELLGHEGGYSNNPSDPGGETMWGVTKRIAIREGYHGDMKDMPLDIAQDIYHAKYWLDICDRLPYSLAFNIFDACVNHGVRQSIRFLQRAIGVQDDGVIGRQTMEALFESETCKTIALFNAERLTFYTKLTTWSVFGKGWSRRVAHNLKIVDDV